MSEKTLDHLELRVKLVLYSRIEAKSINNKHMDAELSKPILSR